ncbi:LysM peptidoglycan-binding domain-containing protein, partial [Methylobacterium crusticola]
SLAPSRPPSLPAAEAALAAARPDAPPDARASEPGSVFVAAISTAKVTRGDNLWSISRKAYGKGYRYTVIFDANQGQIRNPNRIYPGQVFVLPGEAPPVQGAEGRG